MGIRKVATTKALDLVKAGEDALERLKLDGYFSLKTGLGSKSDKTTSIDFFHTPRFVNEVTVNMLYSGDALAGRIIDSIVDDGMSKGWSLQFSTVAEDGGIEPLDPIEAAQLNATIETWEKRVGLVPEINKHWKRGRAHGGGLLMLGVDDGVEDKAEPLREGGTFDWLRTFTRWEVTASHERGEDPKDPFTFGKPIEYRLDPNDLSDGLNQESIHATRVIRYEGVQVADNISGQNVVSIGDTFGDSIFERVWNPLKNWNSALQGAGHIIQDFAQAVYSVEGFRAILRAKGGMAALLNQFNVMNQFRSMFNATVVDASDTYERKTTSVAGMPDLIDKFGHQLSAASGMPLTRLIGLSPGGFGTGEAEQDNWNTIVGSEQQAELKPLLERIYSVLFDTDEFRGKIPEGGWKIVFTPLKPKSEKEQAEIQKSQAETDTLNIASGVVTQDEVAASRFGKGGFSLDTQVDLQSREEMEAAEGDVEGEITDANKAVATAAGADVAKTAMNGAQIVGLIDIVKAVGLKELPRDSAISIIQVGYQLTEEEATAIIGANTGEGFNEADAEAKAEEEATKQAEQLAAVNEGTPEEEPVDDGDGEEEPEEKPQPEEE